MLNRLWLGAPLVALLMTTGGALALTPASGDWWEWRGPQGLGVGEGTPPAEWDAEKNIKWKVAIPGTGKGTPIVVGDKVFITSAVKTDRVDENAPAPEPAPEAQQGRRGRRGGGFGRGSKPTNYYQFVVHCLDRKTGESIWSHMANEQIPHEGLHQTNCYASGSPVTDGERLYVSFGSFGIYTYDLDGNLLWERDLGDMRTAASFGEGASPSVWGDKLIVPWDHEEQSFVVAFDSATGEELWRTNRDEGTTWTTPLITEAAGHTQVILNGANRVRSYDLENGELIWECGGQVSNTIPSPVRYGDYVCCMSGYRGAASRMIRLDSKGDVTDDENQVIWSHNQGTPYVPSPLLYGERIYFYKGNNGILTVLNAKTGEPVIDQKRLPGVANVYASPVAAAGRVYLTDRDGTTLVLKDGDSGELEVLATNELGEAIDASPAVAGDEIFLRAEGHVYCVSEN